MTDKGTTDAIFTLRALMEWAIEVQKDLYLCFVDYSMAFDKVKHYDLFDIFLRHNCDVNERRGSKSNLNGDTDPGGVIGCRPYPCLYLC